jgi:hypothetical protein
VKELTLASQDEDLGPRIRECRIFTPEEVSQQERLKRVKEKVRELRGLLQGDDDEAKELRARLEAAMDDISELHKLEEKFISQAERLRLGTWPEGEDFLEIEEAALITDYVTRHFRPELRGYEIRVVFQERVPPVNRRGRLGTMTRLPGKMKFVSEIDAVITLGFDDWRWLSDRDRQRLVHHELEHLVVDEGLKLIGHDFEEFKSIVELYGLESESKRFSLDGAAGVLVKAGSQLDLLDRAS